MAFQETVRDLLEGPVFQKCLVLQCYIMKRADFPRELSHRFILSFYYTFLQITQDNATT